MDRVVPLHGGNRELMEEAMITTFPELYEYVTNMEDFVPDNPFAVFRLIMKSTQEKGKVYEFGVKNSDWYNQLLKAIHRYAVDPEDLRSGQYWLRYEDSQFKNS